MTEYCTCTCICLQVKDGETKEPEETAGEKPADEVKPQDSEEEERKKEEEDERAQQQEEETKKKEEEERLKKEEEDKQKQLEESSLMNQTAEKEAFQALMAENVRLQAEFEKMQKQFDEIKDKEGGSNDVIRLNEDNKEKAEYINRLEEDINILRKQMREGSAGSVEDTDAKIRDLQSKLSRLAREDEEKDKEIKNLNHELKTAKLELQRKDAKLAELGDGSGNQQSKSCVIL